MAAGIVQTPSSPDQDGTLLDGEASLHRNHLQNGWGYTATSGHSLAAPNGAWQGDLPLTPCYNYDSPAVFDARLNGAVWPNYGTAPTGHMWDPSADGPVINAGPYGPVWPLPLQETVPNNSWSPADQPLPSPLSEAPSYGMIRSPWAEDGSEAGQASPTAAPNSIPTPSNPALKQKDKSSQKKKTNHPATSQKPSSSTKRQVDPTAKSRPRTLKRHRSDTPSIASTSTSTTDRASTSTSTGTGTSTTTTTLGGVLPANVDPRIASEQIRREAWERCKAEAHEMSQRRMMLLDHERGALERETQRLQVNLGLMREAVKREQAGVEEAADRVDRAGRWVDGS